MATYKDFKCNKNDDFFTTSNYWKQIAEYIPKNKVISMPFYSPYSKCNELLSQYIENKIIYQDEDFFENDRGDIIVDNPPYSIKKEILKKIYERNKPFMMILPVSTLCYKYFRKFKETNNELQILIPNGRQKFIFCNPETGETKMKKSTPAFDSCIICWKINLKSNIIFLD